jgi:hypothetical protein
MEKIDLQPELYAEKLWQTTEYLVLWYIRIGVFNIDLYELLSVWALPLVPGSSQPYVFENLIIKIVIYITAKLILPVFLADILILR